MTVNDDSNPYTSTPSPSPFTQDAANGPSHRLTDNDLKDLRLGTQRAKDRSARFEPYLWPSIVLLFAIYQFWMCWNVSENSGISFAELVSHDGAGFPAESYDGGVVRMFDRFVSGFYIMLAAGFMFFMLRSGRKRDLQNARFHETMLNAGIVTRDAEPNVTEDGK